MEGERAVKFAAYTEERRSYWTKFAETLPRWEKYRSGYQQRLAEIYSFLIPQGMRVLEIGCGRGDLLAALKPSYGVGVDFCPAMLDLGQQHNPGLNFVGADAHTFDLGETFDYIICADLVNDLWDIQQVMERIARHCHPGTRVILNAYSRLWEFPRRMAEAAGIAKRLLTQNWVVAEDLSNLLYLSNLELIRQTQEILWPFRTPALNRLANRYLAKSLPLSDGWRCRTSSSPGPRRHRSGRSLSSPSWCPLGMRREIFPRLSAGFLKWVTGPS